MTIPEPDQLWDSSQLKKPTDYQWLARVFHTALLGSYSRENGTSDPALYQDLTQLMSTSEFRAILKTADDLAHGERISHREACERLIVVFKNLDRIWSQYLIHQGIEKIQSQSTP